MIRSFEAAALLEYRDAARYSARRFGLGDEFVQAVEAALKEISDNPARFQAVGQGVRMYRLKRFPSDLFYHYSPEIPSITIYAVVHHHRKPDYWRTRLRGD